MEKIEQIVNHYLNKFPKVKRIVKRLYQRFMYLVSSKEKYQGEIRRLTPQDGHEYFYGYYDTSPWDNTDRYIIGLKVRETTSSPEPREPADIFLLDTKNNNMKIVARTNTWNVQQGAMLQWLGPDYSKSIIFNNFSNETYFSTILDVTTGEEKKVDLPIYTVSKDGSTALTLDFSRLHSLRPGYGYPYLILSDDELKRVDVGCIWKIDLKNNSSKEILKFNNLIEFQFEESMEGAYHKVNHIMINPSGTRFMFLHRWFKNGIKHMRLLTADMNGKNLYCLNNDMTSHSYWKNDNEIISFARNKNGNGYYLFKDKTSEVRYVFPNMVSDGHPSYSPDRTKIITDTYPDRKRMSHLYLLNPKTEEAERMASVFAPFKYDNETRCDLHPRWNRKGNKICFDAVFEGKRAIYEIEVKR